MTGGSEQNNSKGSGLDEMELAANKKKTMKEAPVEAAFPLPKFLFVLHSPVQVIFEQGTVEGEIAKSVWKGFSFALVSANANNDSNSVVHNKKIRVKMQTLILKMINRLIRDQLIPAEAINVSTSGTKVQANMLVSASALPVLMRRCEHIGIGNVVGKCYAVPLETSAHPEPGSSSIKEITVEDLPAADTPIVEEKDEDDEESVSTVEEDEDSPTAPTVSSESTMARPPKSIGIPLLTKKRKAELTEKVVKARKEWLQTASNLRVEQVAEEITAGAAFTWDYIAFVFCASTIAAVGLGIDSSATVLASMLVSPIMGPVLGFTFGTTLRRKQMILKSLRNEVMSLLICILVGLFWGIIAAVSPVEENRDWPSSEMESRGDVTGLVTGIFIALPSGVATALSTLGKNSSGMVGVAISLSLLPPAVNAGLCWMYSILLNANAIQRAENDDSEYWKLGTTSFGLTLVNICCIWLSGVFTFWLKEVSPYQKKNAFWSRDIQAYREVQGDMVPNVKTINSGIKAALELQEAAGNEIYQADFDETVSKRKVAAARRKGLAANATEDAFFMDTNFGLDGEIIPGGAAGDALPDETTLQNEKKREDYSLVQDAVYFGGALENAGKALFDDRILMLDDLDDVSLPSDTALNHEDVANEILWKG